MPHADIGPGPAQANRRVALRLGVMLVAMFGLAFALVPLYDVFCRVTGLNGKTGRIDAASALAGGTGRSVRVEFVANVNLDLPLSFAPLQSSMIVDTGLIREIRYRVVNRSATPLTVRAVPSVAPASAARYFNKVECFCFSRQELQAGQSVEMPARFVVDPELPAGVGVITLSYTFFAATDPPTRAATSPPKSTSLRARPGERS